MSVFAFPIGRGARRARNRRQGRFIADNNEQQTNRHKGHDAPQRFNPRQVNEEQLDLNTKASVIKVVPKVIGAGGNSGLLSTILGAVLIVAGVFTFGATSAMGVALIGAGIGMAVGGIAQMLMPKVDSTQNQNEDGNKANKGFGGAVTTIAQGNPVPILYGQREVGGFIASAGQYPEDQM